MGVTENTQLVERYTGRVFDRIICNTRLPDDATLARYAAEDKTPLLPSSEDEQILGDRLVSSDLWTDRDIARHDSIRLAQLVFALVQEV